uniref:Ras-related GTP-binding protein n=1 Tax=Takifugu rubripes TaxID=31033 RepID=H2SKZ8_TAKRU
MNPAAMSRKTDRLAAEDEDSPALAYWDEEDDLEADSLNPEVKPRILLMGLRRSGKSSIQKVVFHKMSPSETLFLESTNKICREDVSSSSFVSFQIWDFPGQIDFFDPTFDYEMIFRGTGALIFVIDSQDDYVEAVSRLHLTVTRAYKVNTNINFEVFIHKVDGLSDDHKIQKQRDIHRRANDDLVDAGLQSINLSFYLTSIYDHSIFEAFSKVVQKLIPQLPTLENLLNIFISNSCIEKAFLFDVLSKIYIATDSSPVDMSTYELCCDMIDVVIDISSLTEILTTKSCSVETQPFISTQHPSRAERNQTVKYSFDLSLQALSVMLEVPTWRPSLSSKAHSTF